MIPATWDTDWNDEKLYVSLISPGHANNIMGGCFGGDTASVRWLCSEVNSTVLSLREKNQCGNDQEILTKIHERHPERFVARKAYKRGRWGNYETMWTHLCVAIGKEEPKDDTTVWVYLLVFLACLACLKLSNVLRGV